MSAVPDSSERDLPPGVHPATLGEVVERFGQASVQRALIVDAKTIMLPQRAALSGPFAGIGRT